jgi:hypothetical protein
MAKIIRRLLFFIGISKVAAPKKQRIGVIKL